MNKDEDYVDEGEKVSRSINDILQSGMKKLRQLQTNINNREYNIS